MVPVILSHPHLTLPPMAQISPYKAMARTLLRHTVHPLPRTRMRSQASLSQIMAMATLLTTRHIPLPALS